MTSSKLGFVSVFALVSLSALAFAAACGDRKFDGGDDDSQGNGGAGGEGSSSGGSGNTSGELRISGELRDARFNVAYRAALEIEGEEGDVEFELTDGDLPRGVTLSSDGVLSGKPSEEGVFDFTVVARDAAGNTGSVDLTLRVVRHPWLVTSSDHEAQGQPLLYAVDTRKALPSLLLLSPPDSQVVAYEFSADGSVLAFTVDADAEAENQLYVVDFSGGEPGPARLVEADGSVVKFSVANDGSAVAFRVTTGETTSSLWYAPISSSGPGEPSVIEESLDVTSNASLTWVGHETVVYAADDGNLARTKSDGEFGAPISLNPYGNYEQVDHGNLRFILTNASTICARRAWLYDFANDGALSMAPADEDSYAWPTFDRRLRRVAHPNPNGPGGIFVFDATDTSGEPLGLISPTDTCDRVYWSPDANRVLITNTDSPRRLTLSTIGEETFDTVTVAGDYGEPNRALFLNDERFVIETNTTLHQAFIDADIETTPLHEPLADGYFYHLSSAPDGSWVAFYGALEAEGKTEPFAIDVRGREPGSPRPLANFSLTTEDGQFFWSADSSRLAFARRTSSASPSGKQLMIVDLLHDTALATQVTDGTCYAGTPVTCETIGPILFQP